MERKYRGQSNSYLNSPRWAAFRSYAIKSAGGRCQGTVDGGGRPEQCAETNGLELHPSS